MSFEPLKAEDLPLVNRLLQTQPEFGDLLNVIKKVGAGTKYPVNSFDDLADALGGDKATIMFGGRTVTMAEARNLVPAYYFPIGSERDLVAKISDLRSRSPLGTASAQAPSQPPIKLMPAVAAKPVGVDVPETTIEEIIRITGLGKTIHGTGGF
jgi:hypothetical protein